MCAVVTLSPLQHTVLFDDDRHVSLSLKKLLNRKWAELDLQSFSSLQNLFSSKLLNIEMQQLISFQL